MRPTWDETWLTVAGTIALRSRCCLQQYGCVIVSRENRIIAVGYNSPPADLPMVDGVMGDWQTGELTRSEMFCDEFCPRAAGERHSTSYDNCVSVHSEQNALLVCDRRDREGGTLYVSGIPCWTCAKLVANSGVARVVMQRENLAHREPGRVVELLETCGLEVLVAP